MRKGGREEAKKAFFSQKMAKKRRILNKDEKRTHGKVNKKREEKWVEKKTDAKQIPRRGNDLCSQTRGN